MIDGKANGQWYTGYALIARTDSFPEWDDIATLIVRQVE